MDEKQWEWIGATAAAIVAILGGIGGLIYAWYRSSPQRIKEMKAKAELEEATAENKRLVIEKEVEKRTSQFERDKVVWEAEMSKMEERFKGYIADGAARVQELKRQVQCVREELTSSQKAHIECLQKSAYMEGELDTIKRLQEEQGKRLQLVEAKQSIEKDIQVHTPKVEVHADKVDGHQS